MEYFLLILIGTILVYKLFRRGRGVHRTLFRVPEKTPVRDSRHIPQSVKIAVSLRDGGRCRNCGSTDHLQYDHIYPWSLGGSSHDLNNIQLLCARCNRIKSNRVLTPPPGYGIVPL